MRAIDADALEKEGWSLHRTIRVDKNTEEYQTKPLKRVPTIEPQRKKGEWIPEFDGKFTGGAYWFSCSKCKRIVPEVRNGGWNFCPTCGARMEGEADG